MTKFYKGLCSRLFLGWAQEFARPLTDMTTVSIFSSDTQQESEYVYFPNCRAIPLMF